MSDDNGVNLWIKELQNGHFGLGFKAEKTIFSDKSPYQQIDVIETPSHGKMLLNDGVIMLSERDEFVYHEMITHVPLFVHGHAKKVLIIGGGDGGTVREVLKHDVDRVVMVEIDKLVVDVCSEYMPDVCPSLSDPRLEIVYDDGIEYAKRTNEIFDVVIIDSTDPIGPALPLFSQEFYKRVSEILSDTGIMITQSESPFYDMDLQKKMLLNQKPYFENLYLYLFNMLVYPGGLWAFGFASKGLHPVNDFKKERVRASGIKTRYYNANIHVSSFLLPQFLEDNLKDVVDIVSI